MKIIRLINETQAGQLLAHGQLPRLPLKTSRKLLISLIGIVSGIYFKTNVMKGRMYRAIKSMNNIVKARVRVGGDLTEPCMCP